MIRSSVRSAGLALLLTMSGCGSFVSSDLGTGTPGLNVAEAALQSGSGQIALQVSDGVLRSSPNNVRALAIKGDAMTLLGDYDGATAIFQALLAKDPTSIRANIGLGRIRLAQNPANAEALFQQVLTRDPRDTTALNNLGIARDLQGHHAEAQIAYRQALTVNPDLESARVNLGLSMAMSGQGPAAIELLRAEASQPGAPAKVRHDYAAVLAMAGHRADAEHVLSQDMSPDEIGKVLDSVTGTHTRVVRDTSPEPGREAIASGPRDDDVPPDVVQVPDVPSGRQAAATAPPSPATQAAMAAAMAAPPPTVVRPVPVPEPDAAPQPTNPIAAAVANDHSLSLPIRGTPAPSGTVLAAQTIPDQPTATPVVVAMPATAAAARSAASPLAAPPAPRMASDPNAARPVSAPPVDARAMIVAMARPAPEPPAHPGSRAIEISASAPAPALSPAQPAAREASGPMVQFTAAPSEEAARSFWQELVHRFPDVLGQREPMVIRYEHAGTVFWRLRTEGFATAAEAQSLCARMRAGGQACFVAHS